MIQYSWSDGKTHYDRVIGTTIITGIASVISALVAIFTRLPQRLYALIFFPAFLSLGILTAVHVEAGNVVPSLAWLIATPLLIILYIGLLRFAHFYKPFLVPLRATNFLSQPWHTNITILIVLMSLTLLMGNGDRTLHTRLNTEHNIKQRQWDAALAEGFPQYDNDSSLTMLRAIALANKGLLGEQLFRYDITGDSRSLFPQHDHSADFLLCSGYRLWQTIGFVPRDITEHPTVILRRELRRGTARPAARDYLLCAYLLDRNLSDFAATLPRYYAINDSLPQHYREALLIYDKQRGNLHEEADSVKGAYAALCADYADCLAVMRKQRDATLRHTALRDNYFGTYWYYYYSRTNDKNKK